MTSEQLKDLRKGKGLNQTQFWGRVGLTQSAGSRYEKGMRAKLPAPLVLAINIAYVWTETQALKEIRKPRYTK